MSKLEKLSALLAEIRRDDVLVGGLDRRRGDLAGGAAFNRLVSIDVSRMQGRVRQADRQRQAILAALELLQSGELLHLGPPPLPYTLAGLELPDDFARYLRRAGLVVESDFTAEPLSVTFRPTLRALGILGASEFATTAPVVAPAGLSSASTPSTPSSLSPAEISSFPVSPAGSFDGVSLAPAAGDRPEVGKHEPDQGGRPRADTSRSRALSFVWADLCALAIVGAFLAFLALFCVAAAVDELVRSCGRRLVAIARRFNLRKETPTDDR